MESYCVCGQFEGTEASTELQDVMDALFCPKPRRLPTWPPTFFAFVHDCEHLSAQTAHLRPFFDGDALLMEQTTEEKGAPTSTATHGGQTPPGEVRRILHVIPFRVEVLKRHLVKRFWGPGRHQVTPPQRNDAAGAILLARDAENASVPSMNRPRPPNHGDHAAYTLRRQTRSRRYTLPVDIGAHKQKNRRRGPHGTSRITQTFDKDRRSGRDGNGAPAPNIEATRKRPRISFTVLPVIAEGRPYLPLVEPIRLAARRPGLS